MSIVQFIFIAGTVTPARHTESQSLTLNQLPETVTMKMSLFAQQTYSDQNEGSQSLKHTILLNA